MTEEHWREVTEGVTREGDRCVEHSHWFSPWGAGISMDIARRTGCRIERRVAEPAPCVAVPAVPTTIWTTSAGGTIAPETPAEAAEREQREEDRALGRLIRAWLSTGAYAGVEINPDRVILWDCDDADLDHPTVCERLEPDADGVKPTLLSALAAAVSRSGYFAPGLREYRIDDALLAREAGVAAAKARLGGAK